MKARQNQQQRQWKCQGRQRRYQKAGRVKTEKHTWGTAQQCQTGLNKTSQCLHGSVLLKCVCVNEVQVWWDNQDKWVIGDSCVIGVMVDGNVWVQWMMGDAVHGWCAAVVWCKRCGEWQPDSWQLHWDAWKNDIKKTYKSVQLKNARNVEKNSNIKLNRVNQEIVVNKFDFI